MSPAFFSRIAVLTHPHRMVLFAVSVIGVVLAAAAIASGALLATQVAMALIGPVVAVPWALLCAGLWFHPEHGILRPAGPLLRRIPDFLGLGVRWHSALTLGSVLLLAGLVWPVVAVLVS